MNGAHDLGGMHGLGPINPEPEADEPVFHAAWEKRIFGMNLAAGSLRKWNLDVSRYARERQHPVEYLRHTYYENWLAGLETLLLESGLVTADELATGKVAGPVDAESLQRVLRAESVAEAMAKGAPVDMDIATPPRFHVGDRVRAESAPLRAYARTPLRTRPGGGGPGTLWCPRFPRSQCPRLQRGAASVQRTL